MNTLSAAFGGFESVLDAPLWVMLLVKATAVLAAAWVAHLALARANPRWRVVLWRATAVGLLALPALAWSLPALTIDVESTNFVGCVKTHHEYTSSQDPWCVQTNPTDVPVGLDKPVQSAGLPPAVTIGDGAASHSPLPNRPSTMTLGLALWISGVALLLLRLALGYVRVRRVVRRTVSAAAAIRRECLRVAHAVGCRTSVEVVQSADVSSPILIGLARPRLLLPARMDEASYRADLPGILAHELAHVRSRDVFWNLAMELISIALWFHPLAWRMRRVHLAACELVSDAVSAGYVGDVARYCRTLARVAVETYRPLPRSGIAMARTSSIGRRLAVLRKRVFHLPLRRPSVVAFTLSAAVAVALVGALQFALAAAPEKGGTSLTAAKGVAEEGATAGLSGSAETKPIESARADKPPVAPAATLRVTVLDPDGKPLPEAKVHASIWTEEKDFKHNRDYMTDAAGVVQVELPKTYSIVRLWASKKPFVTRFVHWEQNELAGVKGLPEETTVQLRPGVTIGGRIVDEQGKPIAGVKVELFSHDAVTTDADGRWQIDCVANDSKKKLLLSVVHPDYVSDERWGELQKEAGITTAMLRDQTATLTMKRGITVQGQVTDPDGKPIKDAIVVEGDNPYDSHNPRKFPTDADGRFRLPALSPRETTLTVIAAGFAPQLRKVNLEADMPPQDFRMARGKPVELRLVDAQGKPFPEINVNIIEWKGSDSIETQHNPNHPKVPDTGIPRRTDKDGIWRWTSAPDDPVKLRIDSYPTKGFAPMEMEVAGGDPPRTVTLKSEHRITGRVTDAATGKPIPAFAIIPINVFRKDWLSASRCNAEQGKDGRLDFLAERTDIPLRLRVEAMGYRTQTGPEFRVGDDSPRTQDFALQPSPPITGVVLDTDGKPVEMAEVLMATPTEDVEVGEGEYDFSNNQKTLTDAAGRFALPDSGMTFAVVAQADAGFAMADFPADQHDAGTLRLRPWASVRGRFLDGGKPVNEATIFVNLVRLNRLDEPRVFTQEMQIKTDVDGRFEFPRVPPAPLNVSVYLGPWRDEGFRSGPSVPLDLKPGQQVELDLGGAGAIVKGKVTLTGNVPDDLDCTYSLNHLIRREPGITPPPDIAKLGFDIRNGWKEIWLKIEGGHEYISTLWHWFVKLAPDGAYQISGVPAGDYDLAIEIYAKPTGCLVEPLGRTVVPVTVTADDAARGEMRLPEIKVEVVPVSAVGDTPKLAFRLADGKTGSLTDFRGKSTLVLFWASWCGPCRKHLPALKKLHEKLAERGYAVVGLALDDDAAAWRAAVEQLEMPWPQGRLAEPGKSGVSSVPAYWLLDADGKIVAKADTPDELAEAIK